LLRWIHRFDETVERAGMDLAPNLICSYLLELSQRFNVFYGKHSILGDEGKKDFRLKLAEVVGLLLKDGLMLLGIEVVERM
jgi:arginyl-tRNA synthetase